MTDSPDSVESWKPVVGYESRYLVSDLGNVRSLKSGITLKPFKCRGRLRVDLWNESGRSVRYIHHLVLEAFIGPRPDGLIALHDNDIGTNNRPTNLSWGTHADNALDAVRNKCHPQSGKTKCRKGHRYSPENTITRVYRRNGKETVFRYCMQCQVDYNRRRRVVS